MADKNESTMKWKVDIMQLKAAMQDAKHSISTANAEFKAATAGMDRWQNSTTGLEAKLKQLNATLPQQKTILAQLEKQYELTAKELGENSKEAQKLKIQIENQKGAIAKTEASISKYTSDLDQMNSATGKLTKTIADQEKELDRLKASYANTVIEFGESSMEAQSLAREISELSSELSKNKKTLQDADSAADKFDASIRDVGTTSKDTNGDISKLDGGFTVLKGTMANLAADAAKGLISGIKKIGSTAVDTYKEITQVGDEIDKESQKLQISAELYQKLSYAMDKSGSSISDVSKGIKNITSELAKVQNGTEGAGKQFDELGISLKNTDGTMKDAETVLMETIDVLADMDDEIARNKAANDIFSKSYSELLPLLNEGSDGIHALMQEAEDYGMVMSDDAVKASADYDDSLTKLNGTIKGVKSRIVQEFIPAVTDIVEGFADMANGSDKGADKVNKGFETMWKKITRMARKYAPETSSVVIPILEKMYGAISKTVTFVIKNFGKIAPPVMAAVVAFTALKAAMAVATTITACKTAVMGLEAGVGMATKAQTLWNAAMAANPIGAVVTAVAALTAAIVLLVSKETEADRAHQLEMDRLGELKDKIDENSESWENLKDAQQQQIDAGMNEMSYYESLKKELEKIVDSNGRVKEGYEERAKFITGQLSEATGKEIELVDGVINGYSELMKSIDEVMEKKRADIILDSQKSMYEEAITKKSEALQNFTQLQDEFMAKRTEVQQLEEEYDAATRAMTEATTEYEMQQEKMKRDEILHTMNQKKEELDTTRAAYLEQQSLIDEYAYNIGLYEKNMQLAHEGAYDQMSTVAWNYIKDYSNASDAHRAQLEDGISSEEAYLARLLQLQDSTGSDIYSDQIKRSEKQIEEQKDSLAKYVSVTEAGLNDVKVEWKDGLDEQLTQLTGTKILFQDAGEDQVQMYANGIAVGEPKSKEEMASVVTNTINEISLRYTNARDAGEYLIDGVNKGVANERKQNSVFATIEKFGNKLLDRLKKSLKEESPSKATDQMGQYLMEGIPQGINKKKNSVLKSVSDAGKSILTAFNAGLSGKSSIGGYGEGKNSLFGRVQSIKSGLAGFNSSMAGSTLINGDTSSESTSNSKNITFNQTINSPKPLDSLTIYQGTNSMLFAAKVRMNDV